MSFWQELFLPNFCVVCWRPGLLLCSVCASQQQRIIHNRCLYCGQASPFGFTHARCKRRNGVDGVLSLYRYSKVTAQIIRKVKYAPHKKLLTEALSFITTKMVFSLFDWASILGAVEIFFVPQTSGEALLRGFNQSEMLAKFLNAIFRSKINSCLIKIKNNKKQSLITASERKKNVRGAFALSERHRIKGKICIIVDDVVTTGSTIKEMARILKGEGALSVYAFSLLRAG